VTTKEALNCTASDSINDIIEFIPCVVVLKAEFSSNLAPVLTAFQFIISRLHSSQI